MALAGEYGLVYTRYADDLTFSGDYLPKDEVLVRIHRIIRKNVHYVLTKGLVGHQEHIGSTDPVYLKRLLGSLCYWRSIESDNRYVSDSITALKRLM